MSAQFIKRSAQNLISTFSTVANLVMFNLDLSENKEKNNKEALTG